MWGVDVAAGVLVGALLVILTVLTAFRWPLLGLQRVEERLQPPRLAFGRIITPSTSSAPSLLAKVGTSSRSFRFTTRPLPHKSESS